MTLPADFKKHPPFPPEKMFYCRSTWSMWITYFEIKTANFTERWQVCTPGGTGFDLQGPQSTWTHPVAICPHAYLLLNYMYLNYFNHFGWAWVPGWCTHKGQKECGTLDTSHPQWLPSWLWSGHFSPSMVAILAMKWKGGTTNICEKGGRIKITFIFIDF